MTSVRPSYYGLPQSYHKEFKPLKYVVIVTFLDFVLLYENDRNVLIQIPSSETFSSGTTWSHSAFEFYHHRTQLCSAHLVFQDIMTSRKSAAVC